jgi:hypothetical protein
MMSETKMMMQLLEIQTVNGELYKYILPFLFLLYA